MVIHYAKLVAKIKRIVHEKGIGMPIPNAILYNPSIGHDWAEPTIIDYDKYTYIASANPPMYIPAPVVLVGEIFNSHGKKLGKNIYYYDLIRDEIMVTTGVIYCNSNKEAFGEYYHAISLEDCVHIDLYPNGYEIPSRTLRYVQNLMYSDYSDIGYNRNGRLQCVYTSSCNVPDIGWYEDNDIKHEASTDKENDVDWNNLY